MPCYLERMADGGTMFLCGDLGPPCHCGAVGGFLCDYPVGEGRTCDVALCASHAYEVAPEIHYCAGHLTLWEHFRDSGGLRVELENVVPFKRPG